MFTFDEAEPYLVLVLKVEGCCERGERRWS